MRLGTRSPAWCALRDTRAVDLVFAAIFGALASAVIAPLMVAFVEVNRHDRQEIGTGTAEGGAIPAGRVAAQTLLLYDYREELRKSRAFVLGVGVEERWTHRLARRLKRQDFPTLTTPIRAARLVDYWSEGTARNALSWSLDDILEELPKRATSRALAGDPDDLT